MKNIVFIIIVTVLLIFNLMKVFEVRKLSEELIGASNFQKEKLKMDELSFQFEQEREHVKIGDSLFIVDAQGNVSYFIDLVKKSDKSIILRLDKDYCNGCNDIIALNIIETVNKLQVANFYVLTNYRDGGFLKMMEEKYRNKANFIYCSKIEVDKCVKQQPFLFMIDSTLLTTNVLVTDKQQSFRNEIYFKYLSKN